MSIPTGELPCRWHRLQGAMALAKVGGLLVFANQLKTEPIHYVANYTLLGERAFCYLPIEGQPTLFISEAWDQERAAGESSLRDVRILKRNGSRDIAGVCAPCDGHLGIVGRELLGQQDIAALETALGRETASATRLLEDVATIKSPYELSLVREAAKMADAGFRKAMEIVKEGLPDHTLVAEIDYAMREMGATDNFQMLAVGKENSGMLLPCGKKIEPGDLLLFEITPANRAVTYSAQLCRTAIFKETPKPLLIEKYRC